MAGSQDPNGLDAPDPRALGAKPPNEDPRELARRLAAEAKARREAQKEDEDPRELARRLAAEAKAKREAGSPTKKSSLASAAPPPGRVVADVTIPAPKKKKKKRKKRPPSEAPAPAKAEKTGLAAAAPPPTVTAPPTPQRSLAERAAPKRTLSAQEALAAALAAEDDDPAPKAKSKARTRTAKPKDAAPKKARRKRAAAPPPAEVPAPAPASPAGSHDPSAVVIGVFPDAEVRQTIGVSNPVVFTALWQAHRARAIHEHDLGLVSTASVLIDAADRLPEGGLVAVRARLAGRDHAVWVDTSRGVLLGVVSPPEIYLAGL